MPYTTDREGGMSMLSSSVVHQVWLGDRTGAALLNTEVSPRWEKLSTYECDISLLNKALVPWYIPLPRFSQSIRNTVR